MCFCGYMVVRGNIGAKAPVAFLDMSRCLPDLGTLYTEVCPERDVRFRVVYTYMEQRQQNGMTTRRDDTAQASLKRPGYISDVTVHHINIYLVLPVNLVTHTNFSDVLGWASSPEPTEPGPFKPKPGTRA